MEVIDKRERECVGVLGQIGLLCALPSIGTDIETNVMAIFGCTIHRVMGTAYQYTCAQVSYIVHNGGSEANASRGSEGKISCVHPVMSFCVGARQARTRGDTRIMCVQNGNYTLHVKTTQVRDGTHKYEHTQTEPRASTGPKNGS